jgi:hypothetical protein
MRKSQGLYPLFCSALRKAGATELCYTCYAWQKPGHRHVFLPTAPFNPSQVPLEEALTHE